MKNRIKNDRIKLDIRIWRFDIDILRHINTQCFTLGFCVNWNFKPSVEIDFLFWTLNVEYSRKACENLNQ